MELFWTFMLLMVPISWGFSCREGEKLSLLQFKEGLHDPSGRLKTWNASTNCCEWDGILCHRDAGHVVHLDLRYPRGYNPTMARDSTVLGIYASDVLSPVNGHDVLLPLFNLTMLEHLDLSYNDFVGVGVPHQFHTLKQLQYLNLSNAGFEGKIPRELSNMSRLRHLDLSTNPYISNSSLTIEDMQMWIGNLRDLEELLLDEVNMSHVASDEWAQAISTMYSLRRLQMSNCELSGPIPTSLANLTHLTHLQLGGNFFFSSIPARLQNLSKLVSLKLGSCELNGSIPCDLLKLPNLQEVDLSANLDLGGNLPSILPGESASLNSLVLSATIITGGVPDSIANMSSLILLDLSYCLLQGMLPSTIANLSRLEKLDISANTIQGKIPPFGARPSLGKSFPLAYIDLSYNKLEGSIPSSLLGAFVKLSYVNLNQNRLSGAIPSPSRNLTSLEWLYLRNNQLKGRIPSLANLKSLSVLDLGNNLLTGEIPASIGQLFSLTLLDLSSNMLSQAITRNISNLSKLQVLSLSSNRLSGNFSEKFFLNLDRLVDLDISNNMLSVKFSPTWIPKNSFRALKLRSCNMEGELPAFLTTQFNIDYLDLSDNRLCGNIPSWIWDSQIPLQTLNLSHNHFTGALPSKLMNTPLLKVLDLHCNNIQGPLPLPPPFVVVLDLSENHFSASIPAGIGEYKFSYLSLSHNNLSGSIPSTICHGWSMQILDLSNNRFTGKIPKGFVNCNYLQVLNLGENYLDGQLPAQLGNMSSLRTLKINRNSLNGVLPAFANCTQLQILDVGDNNLTGSISSNWILKLPNLKILILRSNRFEGSVPADVSKLPSLQILDLSMNRFSGVIPDSMSEMKGMVNDSMKTEVFEFGSIRGLTYIEKIIIRSKGSELEYVRALSLVKCLDLSSNKIGGSVPGGMGSLIGLIVLNISRNNISGPIPESLGRMVQLESLDLSRNQLSGIIPVDLINLTFLSVLDVSYNNLTGPIPQGRQFATFEASSFSNNSGLFGFPLNESCGNLELNKPCLTSHPTTQNSNKINSDEEDDEDRDVWWEVGVGLSFAFGFNLVIGVLCLTTTLSRKCFQLMDCAIILFFESFRKSV